MKEEELDTFVGKNVNITDFENEMYSGKLYKIINHKVNKGNLEELHRINNGYLLDCFNKDYDMVYRKSHIKKIESIN